jgi:hypothetical protein
VVLTLSLVFRRGEGPVELLFLLILCGKGQRGGGGEGNPVNFRLFFFLLVFSFFFFLAVFFDSGFDVFSLLVFCLHHQIPFKKNTTGWTLLSLKNAVGFLKETRSTKRSRARLSATRRFASREARIHTRGASHVTSPKLGKQKKRKSKKWEFGKPESSLTLID